MLYILNGTQSIYIKKYKGTIKFSESDADLRIKAMVLEILTKMTPTVSSCLNVFQLCSLSNFDMINCLNVS